MGIYSKYTRTIFVYGNLGAEIACAGVVKLTRNTTKRKVATLLTFLLITHQYLVEQRSWYIHSSLATNGYNYIVL